MADTEKQWQSWVRRLADGDQQVAEEFWGMYGVRLQGLAAQFLGNKLRCREGPEDVVQSVCRTFFRRAQGGQFALDDSQSLWRLLCAITVTKVREKARFHGRGKRTFEREWHYEATGDDSNPAGPQLKAPQPTPAEAAEFADELGVLLSGMDDEERRLVELKLEQYTTAEIAQELGCSERTVRRILKRVQSRLQRILEESSE
jgi:RNA polymerase sigma-70 factor (ECF subfamily)